MVRVNLINPKKLSDQHLIAEYNEILILGTYIKKYPGRKEIPKDYCLGKGHMKFFKDKIKYLEFRHKALKREMKKRGIQTNKSLSFNNCKNINKQNKKQWKPNKKDFEIIKKRIIEKLELKPTFYRYCKEKKPKSFFLGLLKD
jgi:deoxyribonuclease (pyrimidine dimer)